MKGIVKDKDNKPFLFANVYQSDASGKPLGNVGTITDNNGLFDYPFVANTYITVSTAESNEKLTFYNVGTQAFKEIILKRGFELSEVEIKAKKIKKGLGIAFLSFIIYNILK